MFAVADFIQDRFRFAEWSAFCAHWHTVLTKLYSIDLEANKFDSHRARMAKVHETFLGDFSDVRDCRRDKYRFENGNIRVLPLKLSSKAEGNIIGNFERLSKCLESPASEITYRS